MIPTQHTYNRNGVTYLTTEYVKFLSQRDLIIDASEGGLIQGPSVAEGGITLIGWNKDAEVFISGRAEGWQFLINAFAEFDKAQALGSMSKYLLLADHFFIPYPVPSHINVFNVLPREVDGQMITPVLFHSTSQICIMPKVPAKANLSLLDTLNREAWLSHVIKKQPKDTIRESALLARFGPTGQN